MQVILHERDFDRWLDCEETERLFKIYLDYSMVLLYAGGEIKLKSAGDVDVATDIRRLCEKNRLFCNAVVAHRCLWLRSYGAPDCQKFFASDCSSSVSYRGRGHKRSSWKIRDNTGNRNSKPIIIS
jgi:hypothetical protein